MNRLLLVALFLFSLPFSRSQAQQFGQVAATFNFAPAKLLPDPARPRVYATVSATGSVVVIDVSALKILATIPIGSKPLGMAISPDGNRLYVANSGSSLAAIGVIDLNTLQALPSFPLPTPTTSVAAGLGNRLYAVDGPTSNNFYQLDAATGAVQSTLSAVGFFDSLLVISPDLKMLFSSVEGYSPSTVSSYDVSTSTIVAKQTTRDAGSNGEDIAVSHNGLYLCRPAGGGNGSNGYGTALYSTADITMVYGTFATGAYPGPLAFSPDDSLVYQARYSEDVIEVFDTKTFNMVQTLPLNSGSFSGVLLDVTDVEVDNTGSYLLVGRINTYSSDASKDSLTIYSTGRGPLTPPLSAPVITSDLTAAAQTFQPFTYQIVGTNSPASYTASGLPTGLSLNAATGVISGSPAVAGTYSVTIGAVNSGGQGSATLSLSVTAAPLTAPVITSANAASAQQGQPFSFQITASGLPTRFGSTALPPGLSLNPANGLISGTPTAAGAYAMTITAQNPAGSGTQTLILNIAAAPPSLPVITSASTVQAFAGQPFVFRIAATGSPTSYAASDLPPGLVFDGTVGIFSGTPTQAGDYTLTVSAANAVGAATSSLAIHVASAPPPTVTITASEPATKPGSAQAGEFTISRKGDLSTELKVAYAIKGSAAGGLDYQELKGVKKIKAGKASVRIRVLATGDLDGAAKKTVKLVLQSGEGYTVGEANQAKVKILAP